MRSIFFVPLILLAFAAIASAEKPDLPPPPDGFQWHWNEEMQGALLKPAGWYVKEVTQKGTLGVFLTKEDINKEGSFRTGLSVNVLPGVGKKTGGKASDYAKAFVREAIKDKEKVLVVLPPADRGRIKSFGCRIKRDETVVHHFLIADDQTDKVYLLFFESPEAEFDTAWKTGEVIMKKLFFQFPN